MDSKRNTQPSTSAEVRKKLHTLAEKTPDKSVMVFDTKVRATKDLMGLFLEFEATQATKPKADPALLLAWTRMQWIKLELTQQAHQRAGLDNMRAEVEALPAKEYKAKNDALDARTLPSSIARAIQEDAHTGVPLGKSLTKLSQIMLQIVGTEHPTDPLAQEPRTLLHAIANHSNDKALASELQKLQALKQPIPPTQRTVIEEVLRNIQILLDPLYDSLPQFVHTILSAYKTHYGAAIFSQNEELIWQALEKATDKLGEARQLVKHAYWPGFDADGNHNVTPAAGREATDIYRLHASTKQHAELEALIKSIPDNADSNALLIALRKLQTQLSDYNASVKSKKFKLAPVDEKALAAAGKLPLTPTEAIVAEFDGAMMAHKAFLASNPAVKLKLRLFGMQLRCFGLTYGVGHIRQDSSVFAEAWNDLFVEMKKDPSTANAPIFQHFNQNSYLELAEEKRYAIHKELNNGSATSKAFLDAIHKAFTAKKFTNPITTRELERMALSVDNRDMIENIIISNTTSASSILAVRSLRSVFTQQPDTVTIVPLLETREDLLNYDAILRAYIAACPVKPRFLEVMFGFSDTERVSGIFALLTIQLTQEKFIALAKELNLEPRFYFGPGGDPNRGGLKKRLPKATLQGNARSIMLSTPASTLRYCETLFYTAYQRLSHPAMRLEFARLPLHLQELFSAAEKDGTGFYEKFHNTENGFGKLLGYSLGQGVHWLVEILNSSSRASQRTVEAKQADRAAAIQTGGKRPAAYVHPEKPRAITAAQIKEILRDYINIIIGPGFALRDLELPKVVALYDASETIRDAVAKTLLGLSMVDLRVTSYALFGKDLTALPILTKAAWAAEHKSLPEQLQKMNVEAMSQSPNDKPILLGMLEKLFALIRYEYIESCKFFFDLNTKIHGKQQTAVFSQPTDLLQPFPEWKSQTDAVLHDLNPVSILIARINFLVQSGANLNEIYPGINIVELLGNIGNAATAARIMPRGFYEDDLDLHTNLSAGVTRATAEALALKPKRDEKAFTAAKTPVNALLQNMLLQKKKLEATEKAAAAKAPVDTVKNSL